MRSSFVGKIAPAVLIGALVLTGCAKMGKPATGSTNPPAAAQKPPLNVPAQFASEDAKRDFAMKAVTDKYYKEGAKLLEETVAVQPSAPAYAKLGTARYNLADYKGTVDAWNKAAELDPSLQAEAQNNIGNALRDSKDLKGAEAAYRKALEIEPNRITTMFNLAELLKQQNRITDAIAVLDQNVPAVKDNPTVQSVLASLRQLEATQPKG